MFKHLRCFALLIFKVEIVGLKMSHHCFRLEEHQIQFFMKAIICNFSNGRLVAIRAEDGIQLWEKPISRIKGLQNLKN